MRGIEIRRRRADSDRELAGELAHEVARDASEVTVADLGVGPRADEIAVARVQRREALEPLPKRRSLTVVRRRVERRELARQVEHLGGHVLRDRPKEVLLRREVEVEGAVGGPRRLDHVVDARRVVARARRTPVSRRRAGARSSVGHGRAAHGPAWGTTAARCRSAHRSQATGGLTLVSPSRSLAILSAP